MVGGTLRVPGGGISRGEERRVQKPSCHLNGGKKKGGIVEGIRGKEKSVWLRLLAVLRKRASIGRKKTWGKTLRRRGSSRLGTMQVACTGDRLKRPV